MARRQAIARACIAASLGLVGTVAMAAPAGAAKVLGAGTVTCSYGSTITFDPPLTPGRGTVAGRGVDEVMTLAPATIGSCTGTVTSGPMPTSGVTTKPVVVKVKPVVLNRVDYVGGCLFLAAMQFPIKHAVVDWTAASGLLRPSKVAAGTSGFVDDESGNLGFTYGGAAIGSFAGPATLGLFFDAASSSAIMNCESNVPGSVSSVTVDPTQSSISFG